MSHRQEKDRGCHAEREKDGGCHPEREKGQRMSPRKGRRTEDVTQTSDHGIPAGRDTELEQK